MILLQIVLIGLIALIAYLWLLGGGKYAWARDIIVPIIIGAYFCFTLNWIVGVLTAGSCQIIREGYGAWDPEHDDKPSFWAKVTHDRNGWWIRAIVGAIHGIVAPIALIAYLFFFKHVPGILLGWILFVIANSLSNFLVSRLRANRLITDLVVGGVFATILFFK